MVSVAIIGGGPGGIGTARVLIENDRSYHIDIFEGSSKIGGVWNYDPTSNNTAMYEVLETNISDHLMSYQGFRLDIKDASGKIYPTRQQVQEYLESYYDSKVASYPKLRLFTNKAVNSLKKVDSHWEVNAENDDFTYMYDYVVVANGHFNKPFVPTVPGSLEWVNQSHSKDFVSCKHFQGMNVVVVGNATSAIDIATQLSTTAAKVYQSVKPDAKAVLPDESIIKVVPQIKSLHAGSSNKIQLIDGTSIEDIDHIIWATGFQYDIPFLKSYQSDLFRDQSNRLFNLWEHIVYRPDPTIFFSLLMKQIIPFQLAELQASIMDLVISGSIAAADITNAPYDSLNDNIHEVPSADYHLVQSPKDIQYYRHLQDIIDKQNLNSPFKPVLWTDDLAKERENCSKLKAQRQQLLVKWAIHQRSAHEPYTIPDSTFE
ncbi:unnamed protein product [Kluyveromyces dobzhanskii CBS 2104]|uniref:WGS project CCBQ000000000 data, contig 00107 n=1 Tax=Kluyveromyces dobzhanskii CBS 2104 TaxID=1427455 RepID=A0A0A8L1C0_9SACH|nr:unnamed protein product [Kluyveromyces dobzhanskii CBS 2104]